MTRPVLALCIVSALGHAAPGSALAASFLADSPAEPPPPATAPATEPVAAPATDPTPAPATAPTAKENSPSPESPAADESPWIDHSRPRVILQVDRHTEVAGYVEIEDQDVLVIRTTLGEIQNFVKTRLFRIVRLIDDPAERMGRVFLRNGQVRRGRVIEDDFKHVIVEIEGITTKLDRDIVDRVEIEPTFQERYTELKKTLDRTNFDGRMAMCRWLIDERQYQMAFDELSALVIDSELPEARRLLNQVQAQLELLAPRTAADTAPAEREERPIAGDPDLPSKLLSRADVNMLRIYEIDFNDPPDVKVDAETIRKLIVRYGSSDQIPTESEGRNRLFRLPSLDIVRLMFNLRARDLYAEIHVLSEPRSLNTFRQRIHNAWLIPDCATSRCHGGLHAGRLFLHTRQYKDERVWATNLLILERLKLGDHPLIDYDHPEDSLIIQHALPRNYARLPHPDVKGWSPVFSRSTKGLYEDALAWIKLMYQPRPDYPIDYEPPKLDAPDKPATPLDGNDR